MKQSPKLEKLQETLRSSKLSGHGFLGNDDRSITEIIDCDLAEVSKAGLTIKQIAERMQEITDIAVTGLGTWVRIDDNLEAMVEEAKGMIVCPWPHLANCVKRVTTVRLKNTGESVYWSDLNIHLIAQHSFFEGKGSAFRIEPSWLKNIIF